jgi:hypothetical protein
MQANEPLVAILLSRSGPEELWVLARDADGNPSTEEVELGNDWLHRLATLTGSDVRDQSV